MSKGVETPRLAIVLVAASALLVGAGTVQAQCTEPDFGVVAEYGSYIEFSHVSFGQSFTACQTGNLTSLSVLVASANAYAGTVNFFLGPEPGSGGTKLETGSALGSFDIVSGGQTVTVDLSASPFPVTEGLEYRIEFERAATTGSNVRIDLKNQGPQGPYADGVFVTNAGAYQAFRDINFSVLIEVPVPMLPAAGHGALVLLLLGGGLVALKLR